MLLQALNQSSTQTMARAIVRANNDPDKLGRIKVEYPWFHAESAGLPSEWARICFPYASGDSGAWMIPEIGDEVLVIFENGNLDTPIVLGTLYNGKNKPPKSGRAGDHNDDNKNHLKFIRTRTGHTLCFDDSEGQGAIVIKDRENQKVEINSKEKKIEIVDTASNKIELKGQDKQIGITDANGNQITLDASSITIKQKGGDEIKMTGGQITIKSGGQINLGEGASHPLVFGDMLLQMFNAHTHTLGPSSTTPPVTPLTPAVMSQKVKTT